MGAETYSPPTSVDRGSAFIPPALVMGSPNGVGDHLSAEHVAPGESHVLVLDVSSGALPAPAKAKGRLARFEGDGGSRIALSDGTAWRVLNAGEAL